MQDERPVNAVITSWPEIEENEAEKKIIPDVRHICNA